MSNFIFVVRAILLYCSVNVGLRIAQNLLDKKSIRFQGTAFAVIVTVFWVLGKYEIF